MVKVRSLFSGLLAFCVAMGLSISAQDALLVSAPTFDEELRMKSPAPNLMLATKWTQNRCAAEASDEARGSECSQERAARQALMQTK